MPAACTGRRSAPAASPASKACARRRGRAAGDGRDRSPSAGRQGRAGLRAAHGHQDRGRSEHREVAQAVARMEAPHRSAALPRSPKDARRRRITTPGCRWSREGWIDREHYYGTINCDGVNAKGEVCGVTTTSGLAWKIPGRAGDSPILGAGLYVDGDVGAAGLDRPRRGEPLQPVVVPHRRGDAPRRAPEGRRASRR